MPKDNYAFYNIPKAYSADDYKEAIGHIINKYSKINGLVSIYGWGGKISPGISDLDFIFVFNSSKAKPMPILKRAFYILNKKFRYIARHPFFYIDDASFKDIRYVYPDAEFKLLYGDRTKIRKLPFKDNYFSRIALLSDIIVRHYPRDFLEQTLVKSINARDMLLRLHSLSYSVKTMEILAKEKNSNWDSSIKRIERLREEWFNRNDFDLLASLNEDAVHLGLEITEKFRDFLIKNGLVGVYSGDNAEYNGARNSTMFVRGWSLKKALMDMSRRITEKRMFHSILPIELAPQQIEYSKHKGPISSHVKDKLRHNLRYKLEYPDAIGKRALIFNSQAELASKLKHSDFAAFFDFGYRSKSGINNIVLNLLRGYRD
ncbi:hypothetical protein HYY71_06760 [Candidatus Woesearchaeota archaeon]|nr:hypothetical protein [Candidatus Woesearchaeota archaeon]